jgi:hypothetical protein
MLMKMEMVLMVCFEMQTGKAFSNDVASYSVYI